MKKLLLSLLSVAFVLSSCSSDESLGNSSPEKPTDTNLYNIKVNLKSDFFNIEKNPLATRGSQIKTEEDETETLIRALKVIAYQKSDGVFVKETIVTVPEEDVTNSNILVDFKLPAGQYTISCIGASTQERAEALVPNNFETDYYEYESHENSLRRQNNRGVYYGKTELTASGTSENSVSLELKPMWSMLILYVSGAEEMKLPITDLMWMRGVFNTHYYGFRLKTGLAEKTIRYSSTPDFDNGGMFVLGVGSESTVDNNILLPNGTYGQRKPYIIAKGANTNMGFTFEYLKDEPHILPNGAQQEKYSVIGTKDINFDSKYQVNNGNVYEVSLDFVKIWGESGLNHSVGITIDYGMFTPGETDYDVELEF